MRSWSQRPTRCTTRTDSRGAVGELSARFGDDQLLEIVIVAGWYRLISYVINAAQVALEPWAERFP